MLPNDQKHTWPCRAETPAEKWFRLDDCLSHAEQVLKVSNDPTDLKSAVKQIAQIRPLIRG